MYTNHRDVSRFLVIMLLAGIGKIEFGCNACGRPATTPVSAQIILEGVVGSDCNFAAMAATGQQHIDIWVRDRWGNGTNITPVSAQIILEGVVGSDCNFAAMAATGQ